MFFFFKQKTAYEMRIRYWSSDVCSSDLQALAVAGFDLEVREFPTSTRTSAEAAAAIGCAVAQIAKSLIFRAGETGRTVLVMASGANRVDEKAVGRLLGERLERADADLDRKSTRLNSRH